MTHAAAARGDFHLVTRQSFLQAEKSSSTLRTGELVARNSVLEARAERAEADLEKLKRSEEQLVVLGYVVRINMLCTGTELVGRVHV